ncbi:uncharacterized protein LOC119598041 [Penaeus monodon]|uniref:uncharacterized protein LOC119598041 n=1 Tax=Penaeus monodon TaxID=6687 RepID=UPI0018A70507|nr:uncharacterized protein LOC119598041 [Penaeus monodon]
MNNYLRLLKRPLETVCVLHCNRGDNRDYPQAKLFSEEFKFAMYKNHKSIQYVKCWMQDFKAGRESLKDEPRSDRNPTLTTQKNTDKVHEFVKENRRISIDEIEKEPGISHGSVVVILHEHLHMNNVCAR